NARGDHLFLSNRKVLVGDAGLPAALFTAVRFSPRYQTVPDDSETVVAMRSLEAKEEGRTDCRVRLFPVS
ncbi:MAG: hypothetical protein AAFP78_15860, partial [Pseudomonadota bacterium]